MERIKNRFSVLVIIFIAVGVLSIAGPITSNCYADSHYTTKDLNEQGVMSTLWVQTSAEFRALCYQAFNLAKMNLDAFLSSYSGSKKVAISVDVDETLIDNSAYQAFLVGKDFGYSSKTWGPWIASGQATAYPGAHDFLNYAKSKGVEVFYITNIKMKYYDGASKKLAALGYPDIDKKHLLFRTDTSDKQPRRDIVEKDYVMALLMGDNLNDFLSVFRKKPVDVRSAEVDKIKEAWGKKFILIPNPMYGDWEAAVIKGNWGASAAEKDQMRKVFIHYNTQFLPCFLWYGMRIRHDGLFQCRGT
jgi:5'-nucleotidase (lipoprotein e(P4) family)